MQRDSISHYVGLSVGRSVPHLLFWQFASSLRITAPAQPHATEVVVYTAPHSAPALPPTAPAPPAPRRGAHRSCPTEREQFLRYCPCPINWNRCCCVYSTPTPAFFPAPAHHLLPLPNRTRLMPGRVSGLVLAMGGKAGAAAPKGEFSSRSVQ